MTLTEQKQIVLREIAFRKKVYPKLVADGKMTQRDADYQIEGMEYVLTSLDALLSFYRGFVTKNERLFR